MNDKLSYAILKHIDSNKLEMEVIKYMQEGWEPIGGVGVSSHLSPIFYQAMVRK